MDYLKSKQVLSKGLFMCVYNLWLNTYQKNSLVVICCIKTFPYYKDRYNLCTLSKLLIL